jgi:hypothetical protein
VPDGPTTSTTPMDHPYSADADDDDDDGDDDPPLRSC